MRGSVQNLAVAEVATYLHSRDDGLTSVEAADRLREVGGNSLKAPKRLWWLRSLGRQFANFFTLLLILSAVLCFVADHVQPGEQMNVLGWALFGVSALNALFSFVQEFRAERAMEELEKFLPQRIRLLRDGAEIEIEAEALVPGDVILLREGDRVPADARLIAGHELTVNNAPLTGEAEAIGLDPAPTEAPALEARNLVFAGCAVVRGSGRAIVHATGFRTRFGRIAMLSHEIPRTASPLEHETLRMVRILAVIAVALGLTFFLYGVYSGRSLWVNLVFMMGIIVANVPEGLLPTFTLSLAMGSLRMAKRNVLVKSLNAVESLGAVHVICTDKTGTLTMNRLTVTRVTTPTGAAAAGTAILEAGLAASDLSATEGAFSGDPLEVAIADQSRKSGGDPAAVLSRVRQTFPFDTAKRRAAGVLATADRAQFLVKGAWESIEPMLAPMTAEALDQARATVGDLAGRGQRVIAVAGRSLAPGESESTPQAEFENGLLLLGFLGLEDPLRPEVPAAVGKCHEAGIGMVMITGDHPDTAEAIARQAGMVDPQAVSETVTVTGSELSAMRESEIIERLRAGACVFARTTPEQKMKIVAALQQMEKVVAVTGDGVNDAPALKAADVGIAMGASGTDVAREAAQVILLDDNFASIVAGIEEGRTIFANIRKFTNYVLVSNGPEIIPYLLYILFPVPLALTVIQILSIDLGTDIIPSMALGQEKPDAQVLKQPPRDRRQGLLSLPLIAHSYGFLGLIEAAVSLSLFFWVLDAGGWQWGVELANSNELYRSATGITLSSILLMQIGNLFGRRSQYGSGLDLEALRNPLLVIGIAFEAVFSWAVLYSPTVSFVLGTGPVDIGVYLVAWAAVPLIFGVDYLRKRIAWRLRRQAGVVV